MHSNGTANVAEALAAETSPSRKAEAPVEPLLVSSDQAAQLCGTVYSTWARWRAAGLTPAPVGVGRALYSVAELRAWCSHGCPPQKQWQAIWRSLQAGR